MLHKKRLFLLTLGLAAALSALQPAVPALADAWERNGTGSYVGSDGSVLTGITARGIDVSSRQQNINWNAVAADDISFVMLGCRYNNTADPSFGSYALGAYNAGIRVGAYLYSYATTTAMAEQEADFVLNLIKDYPISYPVVLDVESEQMSALTPSALADVINAFCRKIENAGYYPMIYTNDYWLTNKIDMSKVHYDVWVARFNAKPAYQNAAMWQATNQGQVNGITGAVDINFSLKDFTDKLPANRWRLIGGNWYYYKNYVKQTGWVNDGQNWYYQNQDGTQYKGWLLLNNQYYYLLPSTGQMQTGWVQIDNTWYYLKQDGTMATEWLNVDNKWYYLLNGAMVTGWLRIGTDYYYLRGDGSMVTGWRLMDGAYYYFNTDGRLVRGWADIDGERYFFRTDGTMVTGWQTIDNLLYYFDPEGGLATKWEQIDGSWYYFGTDGRMMTGWIQVDGRYYYLNTDGKMVTTQYDKKINGAYYTFIDGVMQTGWVPMPKEEAAASQTETAPAQDASAAPEQNGGSSAPEQNAGSSAPSIANYQYYGEANDGKRADGPPPLGPLRAPAPVRRAVSPLRSLGRPMVGGHAGGRRLRARTGRGPLPLGKHAGGLRPRRESLVAVGA